MHFRYDRLNRELLSTTPDGLNQLQGRIHNQHLGRLTADLLNREHENNNPGTAPETPYAYSPQHRADLKRYADAVEQLHTARHGNDLDNLDEAREEFNAAAHTLADKLYQEGKPWVS